ncbi:Uncharacterised protein [Pseudomonas putida]|uniref:hypothetical protein n=1 Tax=Pseudomonas guariconensis TaxID=1288410 RepID=UPI001F978085|nr:hypothetical protein [Pseudomonas guariconensis]CAB5525929.1 Uncharacterised protein [Pseudomonas putida]MDM9595324.1 hypothetical protein [Pseudomonas guariconensis]MDM9608154.1 hypothetical protein [Pseudomonas guariconensis]MDM9613111.1 hypothetical protein [Pseudomonas guariconensis]CAB5529892.1 Uncharacterised protein [Pseudomonas putida]
MKLSDLWPRAGAGKPATPVVSVAVTKRAGAEQPVATGNTPAPAAAPRGPIELPATLAECEALHEQLVTDAIRLELALAQAQEGAAQGIPYNRSWYNRAKAALKHINHDRARLLYRCGQLRKEAKTHAQQHMDRVILDVIKESLPADQFMGFVRIAEARAAQGVAR